jgi:hypothetical protein
MRLLIKRRGDWHTVSYVSNLRRDKYTDWFFRGYEDHPSKDGTKVWSCDLARQRARLVGRKKFGSSKKKRSSKKKSTPNKKPRKK